MKTTAKHFAYFRSRCEYYQKELGLMGWNLAVTHEETDGAFARCLCDGDEKWCTISLTTNWKNDEGRPLTRRELDLSAFHEICHLLLCSLRWLAKTRFTSKEEIDRADEEIVGALENFYRSIT